MGFDDALNKAKDAYTQNEDQIKQHAGDHSQHVEGAIDGASQKAQDFAPDQVDGAIGDAANQGKEGFGAWHGGEAGDTNQQA